MLVQYYLPDEWAINKDFIRAVLAGDKNLFKKNEVDQITVPKYDELSVKTLFPTFKSDKVFMSYFPDTFPKDKGPPRKYFFDILNTIHPDYLAQVMNHANTERMAADGLAQKEQTIKISKFWEEELKSMPYLSRKYFKIFT